MENIKTWIENNRKAIKIVSLSVISLLAVLTIALIPINIFCVNFPRRVPLPPARIMASISFFILADGKIPSSTFFPDVIFCL